MRVKQIIAVLLLLLALFCLSGCAFVVKSGPAPRPVEAETAPPAESPAEAVPE